MHLVAKESEIPPGTRKEFDIEGHDIVVFNIGGNYHAVENYCPHMGGPVANGPVREDDQERTTISCPFHGWQFDIESGDTITPNKKRVQKFDAGLKKYDVDTEEGRIYVDI